MDESRLCTAHSSRTGERCKKSAIKGGTVCRAHGGAAPQVKKSAGERLLEAAEPAAARLVKALESKDERVAIKASGMILDRAGYAPSRRIEIEDSDQVLARVLDVSRDQLPVLEVEQDKEGRSS